ncbi:MAG: hypothetical protein H0W50_01750 [Parachlamydiaceae bacterium]|nr:hypothetical protein [Parachlamydiaceae bacterium]
MERYPSNEKSGPEIVSMFRQSIAPYSKKLVALHPHLYGSLYRRASEIQALDKILVQLRIVAEEAKRHQYNQLPPILEAIKDALDGHSELSWWTLFTTSIGYAFGTSNNQTTNAEEAQYLTTISALLTQIIRDYQSTNTKLLLEVRLTTLGVDARLVELDKIPEGVQEVNETFAYLTSEFELLSKELEKILLLAKVSWNQDSKTFLHYISKTNKLMSIAENIEQTDLATYLQFERSGDIQLLETSIGNILKEYTLPENSTEMNAWQLPQLNTVFELFNHFPDLILLVPAKELSILLQQTEKLFIADPNFDKKRPNIFFSATLKHYVNFTNDICKEQFELLLGISKGNKIDRSISKDMLFHLKNYFMKENDLHHICTLVLTRQKEPMGVQCDPAQIQKETISRMVALSNASQPKDLDQFLKSFSNEQKENQYFLIQEIIMEQFIRWRKAGIY